MHSLVIGFAACGLLAQSLGPAPRQPVQILASTGQPVPGLGEGVSYLDLGTPAVNDAGQIAYAALTRRPGEEGKGPGLGLGVFRLGPDGSLDVLVHLKTGWEAASRTWELDRELGCVINERGQVAAVAFGPDAPPIRVPLGNDNRWIIGGQRPRSGQILFGPARERGRLTPVAKEGDAAAGIRGDHVFHWFDCLRIDEDGTVYFRAGTAPAGRPPRRALDATLGCWRAEPGGKPEPVLLSGMPAPGCDEGTRVRLSMVQEWRAGGLIINGDIVAANARPGDPCVTATWRWTGAGGLELLARHGDPMPGTEPEQRLAFAHHLDTRASGEALFYARAERGSRPLLGGETTGVWVRRPDGSWQKVIEPGDTVDDNGKAVTVAKVLSGRWAADGALVRMSVRDEATPKDRFPHCGLWVFPDAGPPRRLLPDSLRAEGAEWPGFVFRPGEPFDVGAGGDVALGITYGREKENGWPQPPRHGGIWLLTRDGRQRRIHLGGVKLAYAADRISASYETFESRGSAMTAAGEIVFKIAFNDDGSVIARSVPATAP